MVSQSDFEEIVKKYNEGIAIYKIAGEYNISDKKLRQLLKIAGVWIKRKQPFRRKQTYSCDESFFSNVDNESKAYWLGFIAADGAVFNGKRKSLRIDLAKRDEDHVRKFQDAIKSNHCVKEYKIGFVSLTICSQTIVNDLMDKGIKPRKTYNLQWPVGLPRALDQHFMRGFFDGDGSWKISDRYGHVAFDVTSNKEFIVEYQNKLVDYCDIKRNKLAKHQNAVSVQYGGNRQMRKIYDFLYKDAVIWLDRKKEKVEYSINLPDMRKKCSAGGRWDRYRNNV